MNPELSVAIIFKNEIRCIERCLKSLQPLKEHISCEIVMVDTGSTDGSREVAERYADIVFDFPWINDFSAARNAVLDRCTGAWTLVIDCDEWLNDVPEELLSFLQSEASERYDSADVIQRNYTSDDWNLYMDHLVPRLMRMSAKPRYEGTIHESPASADGSDKRTQLCKTVLHHDGYVMLNDGAEAGKAKKARNAALLRAELEKTPDDLRRLLQYIESAWEAEDFFAVLRHAVALVIKRKGDWTRYGAAIMRHAVFDANVGELPEFADWVDRARKLFPQSYYTRIDITFILFTRAYAQADREKVILYGEDYLKAYTEFQNDPSAYVETRVSSLQKNGAYWKQFIQTHLAEAYRKSGQPERALALLKQTDWTLLDAQQTIYLTLVLKGLAGSGTDIGSLLAAFWDGIRKPIPSVKRAEERVAAFREQIAVEEEAPQPENNQVPAELARLAAKVKAILGKYPADDPAIVDLKNSEAYKKVEWLIEDA